VRGGSPYAPFGTSGDDSPRVRLWIATFEIEGSVVRHLERFGFPIRYPYVPDPWPLSAYQTVFAEEPGSAEMPSAGRPFTRDVVDRLRARGVTIAPLVLHTSVASLERPELPAEEFYHVPVATADAVNHAHASRRRVIGVGTSVVRALETMVDARGLVSAGEGWTDLVVTADRVIRSIDGLVTGFHEPTSTHLAMLEAIAGRSHLFTAYTAAIEGAYKWHEFGDSHLILR
jgi:S-adenosylmethionine:tRNA ribosyltransferase-isomerase